MQVYYLSRHHSKIDKMKIQENTASKKSRTFREKAGSILTSRFFIFETILITSFLMWWYGSPGYLIGLAISLITLWSIKWDWSWFGLGKIKWMASIVPALGYTLLIIILNDLLIEPLTEIIFKEQVDLSNFDGMRGNVLNLIIMLVIMWTMAAFGEEFFYRGYIMKRLATLFGDSNMSWIMAAIISSFVFGLVHAYQGISGIITTGIVGFILAMAFYKNRQNLLIAMLTHGIYDTYGIILIFVSKERWLKDLMIEMYQSIITK